MNKWAAVFLTAASLAIGARADSGWGLFGAYWKPDNWDGAEGIGAKISIEMIPNAQLDLRGTWFNDFEKRQDGSTLQVTAIPWEAGLTVRSGWQPVDLYVCGGFSFCKTDGDLLLPGGVKESASTSNPFGYYVGLGGEVTLKENAASYGATRITLFCEALYRSVSADDISVESQSTFIDGDMGGIAINGGLMLRW